MPNQQGWARQPSKRWQHTLSSLPQSLPRSGSSSSPAYSITCQHWFGRDTRTAALTSGGSGFFAWHPNVFLKHHPSWKINVATLPQKCWKISVATLPEKCRETLRFFNVFKMFPNMKYWKSVGRHSASHSSKVKSERKPNVMSIAYFAPKENLFIQRCLFGNLGHTNHRPQVCACHGTRCWGSEAGKSKQKKRHKRNIEKTKNKKERGKENMKEKETEKFFERSPP